MSIVERDTAPAADEPLLITVRDIARLMKISVRKVWRLRSAQLIPEPVRLGGTTVRWRYDEVRKWIDAGCPEPNAATMDG
jgi:predicted DNA-binding transcriptional regulator AlpA